MKWLDPITWLGSDGYNNIVSALVQALFNGTVARILSCAFLIVGVWFIYRRKQTGAGIGLISLSVIVVFAKSIFAYLEL